MIVCGVPMLYMELAVGQFVGRGPIAALGSLCPLLKGTGLGSVVISFFMSTYYCVIIAYGVYYFFTSFRPHHPWVDCTNRWNTENCWIPRLKDDNISRPYNSQTPAEEFFHIKVLQISKGLHDFGTLRWELVACLLCAWVLVYFGLWKSIKSSAKVRYLTATLPFILIIVFLAKSLTLEGAQLGMKYFFQPKWELLGDAKSPQSFFFFVGVFLIPYFLIMIVCGVPMLYMELAVGQFVGRGPIAALGSLCPLLKGTGLGSVVISFFMSTYYCVIIAYGVYYFFTSFRPHHPWVDCTNRWNTENCWIPRLKDDNISRPYNSQTPAEEFFHIKVLQISKGLHDFGTLRWELVACLLCAWVLVYFGLWKSIKSSAKVRYLTATLPFILIIVFLAKSLTLEGAQLGMKYFFQPKWELLGDAKVWVNAAAQTFNSMGIAFGSMISFASYNKYENNIIQDTLAVSLVNAITSLLVGIFAFATLGNIAFEQSTTVQDVITDGKQYLIQYHFQDFKETLNFQDQGGIFFFQLIDHYAASISIMYVAFFEIIAIAWFYGVKRLSRNILEMTGREPSWYFKFCWYVASPLMIFSIWVFYMIGYTQPRYGDDYRYPAWAIAIGWIITSTSILCIPIFMIYVFTKAEGNTCWEKFKSAIKPTIDDSCPLCKKNACEHTDMYDDHEIDRMLAEKRNGDVITFTASPNRISDGNTEPSSPNPIKRIQPP
ncbi:sodium/chloride dependent transporter [Holotrichia oblita]|uniref:Sodium/chloride dependent transporter n=1 Tax=Holotrichia oblita TaxID=644536 RepID=A0ACB9T2R5_HOLOL|nr:sodium/chloride dependent transporter [Holotrichia oblita]